MHTQNRHWYSDTLPYKTLREQRPLPSPTTASNTMKGSHSQSRAASRSKRKNRYPDEQQSESQSHSTNSHRTKRRRVASSSSSFEPETPTLIPDPPRTLPVHNRFKHLHSSSGSRRKQRDQKSNATEATTNRNWVFSSHDLPNYKGLNFSDNDFFFFWFHFFEFNVILWLKRS